MREKIELKKRTKKAKPAGRSSTGCFWRKGVAKTSGG